MREPKPVYRDKTLPPTEAMTTAKRLKAWYEAGGAVLSFCDAENCIGKQTVKRYDVGAGGAVFLCKTHFMGRVV